MNKRNILKILFIMILGISLIGCGKPEAVENSGVKEVDQADVESQVIARADLGTEEILKENEAVDISGSNEEFELTLLSHILSELTVAEEYKDLPLFNGEKAAIMDLLLELKNISDEDIDTSQKQLVIETNTGFTESTTLEFPGGGNSRVIKAGDSKMISITLLMDIEDIEGLESYRITLDDIVIESEI